MDSKPQEAAVNSEPQEAGAPGYPELGEKVEYSNAPQGTPLVIEDATDLVIDPSVLQKVIASEPANSKCFFTGEDQPQMASVNNGCFISITEAAEHAEFGDQFSRVKSISIDPWTEQEIKYMELGGNAKLNAFFEEYQLMDLPADQRLKTEAAAFYRRQLHAQVVDDKNFKEVKPSLKDGQGPIKIGIFAMGMSYIYTGAAAVKNKSDQVGLTDKLNSGKNYVATKASDSKTYISAKAEEHKVSEKAAAAGASIKSGASKAGSAIKSGANKAGAFTSQKAEEFQVKEKAAAAGESMKSGAKKAGAFIGGMFKKKEENKE